MSTKMIVFGHEDSETLICDDLRMSGYEPIYIQLQAPDRFNFDIAPAQEAKDGTCDAMIALDQRGLNISRAKLFFDLKLMGFRLPAHVSSRSLVASNAKLGDACTVRPLAVIGADTKMGVNVQVGVRSSIGRNVRIGKHVFIGEGAVIGDNVTIGDNATIGAGAIVEKDTVIGRYCDLTLRQSYRGTIAENSFFWWAGDGPARIFDFST